MSSSKSEKRNKPRRGNPSALSMAPLNAASPSFSNTSFASLHPSGQCTRKHRSLPSRRASSSASAWPGASASAAITTRETGSSAARQFHRYSNFLSSSGAGTGPSLTLPGAPSGTLTTFLTPACSSASLSISPSTMTISRAPAMSSRPKRIFSAPFTCQKLLSSPRYLMFTSSPSRMYGNTSASTCAPAGGEKTFCDARPLRSATARSMPRDSSHAPHFLAAGVVSPGPTRSRDSGGGSLTAPPAPAPGRRDDIPVPTDVFDPIALSLCVLREFDLASATLEPPVHSHVARWHIHCASLPSASMCTARLRSPLLPPPHEGHTMRCCPGVYD
mmetsp:Transcript_3138/g.12588  ORF Transcript_3138/g.12588 Transcript_3138/m.12588 type:complete len:331 (+) Transcript_3138:1414-2406(+)